MVIALMGILEKEASAQLQRWIRVPQSLLSRARELTEGVENDLDAPLDPDDE